VNTPETQALALQSGADGLVLLKNDGTLPLDLQNKTIGLIGHWAQWTAGTPRQILGGYSGIPPYLHTPVYAAGQLNLSYQYAPGPVAPPITAQDTWTAGALSAASKSDIILYFGGTDLSIAAEDKDRDSIAWPEAQLALIQSLAGLGKPLVIVQLGDQVDDTPLLSNPNISAILWAGYPGQSGGTAVLNAISGRAAPAGRLPVTQYPAGYTFQIPLTEMSLRPRPGNSAMSSSPGRTYRWYTSPVLPFGYGLHYTTFNASFGVFPRFNFTTGSLLSSCDGTDVAYKDLCPFPEQVSVWVSNTGNVTSDYVALVFAAGEFGPQPYPIKTLVGYKRLRGIKPGETAAARIEITLGDLARVNERGDRVLYPGSYRLQLDVPEARVVSEVGFEVGGEEVVLDRFPQPTAEA
jgi:beta-D-xylosidase 4